MWKYYCFLSSCKSPPTPTPTPPPFGVISINSANSRSCKSGGLWLTTQTNNRFQAWFRSLAWGRFANRILKTANPSLPNLYIWQTVVIGNHEGSWHTKGEGGFHNPWKIRECDVGMEPTSNKCWCSVPCCMAICGHDDVSNRLDTHKNQFKYCGRKWTTLWIIFCTWTTRLNVATTHQCPAETGQVWHVYGAGRHVLFLPCPLLRIPIRASII